MNFLNPTKTVGVAAFCTLIVFCFPSRIHAQNAARPDIRFTRLTVADGLSQSVISSIAQDRHGFIWIGTTDGLNRYDGYQFNAYRHDPDKPKSISANYVTKLLLDANDALWIGTQGGGLNRFDPSTQSFKRYQNDPDDSASLSGNHVTSLYEDSAGILWIGTQENGLNRFDPARGTFTRYRHDPNDDQSLSRGPIEAIFEDTAKTLWIGAEDALDKLDHDSGRFAHYLNDPDDPDSLSKGRVTCLYEDVNHALWVGTQDGGLNQLDERTGRFAHYRSDPNDPNSLSNNRVIFMNNDRSGNIWIGTYSGGLNLFDLKTKRFVHYKHDPGDPFSLNSQTVPDILEDREGILWVGTSLGLGKFNTRQLPFEFYHGSPNDSNSITPDLSFVYVDRNDIVWLGNWEPWLTRFDREQNRFTRYYPDPDDPHSIDFANGDGISSIHEDRDGYIWVGHLRNGICRLDPETDRFQHYRHDPDDSRSLSSDYIWSVFEDSDGYIWVGTESNGINRFDKTTQQFKRFQHDPQNPYSISSDRFSKTIYEDSHGSIWIGTGDSGLNRFDKATQQFQRFRHDPKDPASLSNNNVMTVRQDRAGRLWIGTLEGLNQFNPLTETFTRYFEKDGLPNNVVYEILEEDPGSDGKNGNLWLSTNKGLSRFDPDAGSFRNFDVHDGLQSNEFNRGAAAKNSQGEMFFGGINGLSVFHPNDISDNTYLPPVILTDFQLFNRPVPIGDDSPLQTSIWDTNKLTLRHHQNIISIEFVGLSLAAPEKNRYRYKLEGLETDWTEVNSDRRFVTYTNLDPGNYTFRVKASNNDGVWNEEGATLDIAILAPWWATAWFRTLAVLGFAGILAGVFRWRVSAIRYRTKELEKQVEERTRSLSQKTDEIVVSNEQLKMAKENAEVANQAKSQFLANMSHELRTPLNAVLGFSQIMQRQGVEPQTSRHLRMIRESGEHLLTLINDILDLSKIEAGKMQLQPHPIRLPRFLSTIVGIISTRAEAKDLQLVYEQGPQLPESVEADETRLRQVLLNLLGNAVKFTEHGQVFLRSSVRTPTQAPIKGVAFTTLKIEVEDTGIGIPADKLETIFDPFEQNTETIGRDEGTGLGLAISRSLIEAMGGALQVESEPGRGSRFWFELTLPLSEAPLQPTPNEREIVGYQGKPLTALIVDDIFSNRALLVDMLRPLGFNTIEAENGREAIELAKAKRPDIILMDRRMPVMDGLSALKLLKQMPEFSQTPLISISASVSEEARMEVLEAGCTDVLDKPVGWSSLATKLEKCLSLEWQYEERDSGNELIAEVAMPPKAKLEALVLQLKTGSISGIHSWASQIVAESSHYQPLADAVIELANKFDLKSITRLVDQCLKRAKD